MSSLTFDEPVGSNLRHYKKDNTMFRLTDTEKDHHGKEEAKK